MTRQLRIVPIATRVAYGFIATWHRHHQPPPGSLYAIGVARGDTLVGVVTVGRPVARHYDDGLTVEITRCATDGTPNACSALYGAAWRAAKHRGYLRALTYTRDDETGASLRAAGWTHAAHRAARPGWDMPGRRRNNATYQPIGRHRWCVGAWARDVDGELCPDRTLNLPTTVSRPATSTEPSQLDLFTGVAA